MVLTKDVSVVRCVGPIVARHHVGKEVDCEGLEILQDLGGGHGGPLITGQVTELIRLRTSSFFRQWRCCS